MKFKSLFGLWFITLFTLSLASTAYAESQILNSEATTKKPSRIFGDDTFHAGLKLENFEYNEPGMTTKGLLYGVGGTFEHPLAGAFSQSLVFNFELLTGRADYVGSTWGGTPITASNQFGVYEIEAQYHLNQWRTIGTGTNVGAVTPLTGLALRGTSQDKETNGDYRREYYYLTALAGLQLEWLLNRGAKFNLRGQANFLFAGYNNTHLSDADPNMPDVVLNFKSGSSYRLEAEYGFKLANSHELQVALNYTAWSLQPSESQDVGGGIKVFEPVNQTFLTGLNVGYQF